MSDIWNSLGSTHSDPNTSGWVYAQGKEMRGPVPQQLLIERFVEGSIDLKTRVGREDGELHPLGEIRVLADALQGAWGLRVRRIARRRWGFFALGLLVCSSMVLGLGWVAQAGWSKHLVLVAQRSEAKDARAEKLRQKIDAIPLLAYQAQEQDKDEDEGKNQGKKSPSASKAGALRGGGGLRRRGAARPRRKAKPAAPPPMVAQCQRGQGDILGVLKNHLAKINICVEDEKSRDSQGLLPPVLRLEFVVKASGKIVELGIDDRHYRRGPLNNCMTKVFRRIRYAPTAGANCPVTIPIRISK